MATYSIKEGQLPIKVTIGANEASATICWVGVTTPDGDECLKCSDEKIYCENVYIGTNDCVDGEASARTISGTVVWNPSPSYSAAITYEISQSSATCSTCGEETCDIELLNHWISPYVITPSTSSTTLYWEYWLTNEFENDDCDITREKILSSTTITKLNKNIPCDDPNRTSGGTFEFVYNNGVCSAKTDIPYEYFIQKPDVCCDLSGDCYEINEIVYSPTSVPSSGGLVDFSFDYKRIEIDENCETKETYGTYFGKWNVPECKGDECCYTKAVESAFTWFDICGRGDVSVCTISSNTEYDDGDLVYIPSSGASGVSFSSVTLNDKNTIYLSILREKSFSADCEVHCDFQTLYCVDKSTVYTEYYEYESGQWIGIASGLTEGNEPIKIINDYAYPYYGGRLRVSWEYYIITIYEDCTVGISKGNRYTDLLTIAEYDNCKDHEDTCNVHLTTKIDGNKEYICGDSGGTVTISVEGSSEPTCGLEINTSCVTYDGGDIKIEPKSSSNATSTRSLTIGDDESGSNNSSSNNGSCPSLKFKSSSCVTYDGGDITISLENGGCDYAFIVKPNCVPYSGGTITIEPIKGAKYFDIDYEFKTGLCSLPKDQLRAVKNNLPKNILPSDVCEDDVPCNEFKVSYLQISKPCNPDCVPCLYNYMIDDVPSARTVVTREIRSDCNLEVFAYGDGEKNGSTYKNDCSSWVTATIGSGVVTFTIAQNDGPYRRGKVIFTHDDGCKEEIVIIQNGINDSGDYIPDPGYECDLHFEFTDGISCVTYGGGTIEITPIGGGDDTSCKLEFYKGISCVTYDGGEITIIPHSGGGETTCKADNITFVNQSYGNVDGCGGTVVLGTLSYSCDDFNKDSLSFETRYKDLDIFYDNSTLKASIGENTEDNERTIQYTIKYSDETINNGSGYSITQNKKDKECNQFDTLLEEFNEVLSRMGKTQVSSASTPNVYNYLKDGYDRALEEYEGDSELFNENYYDEVYDYRGNNTEYRDTAKQAMLSWLMAEQLSELYADSGKTTNTQTELFKAAYDYGTENGGRSIPVYHENDIHSDVFIARYVASAMYAITRADYTFEQMDSLFRSETNTSPIDKNMAWTDSGQNTEATCDGSYDPRNTIGYALNLYDIFPNASGPYATNYYSGGFVCREVSQKSPDPLQPSSQFNPLTQNYLVDEAIDRTVVENYNLSTSDVNLSRTIQAVADDEDDIKQMLGGITYYKYNASSPKTTFEVGTPSDNMGNFTGTFNVNVIGKDLSSLLSTTDDNQTDLTYFFSGVSYIGGQSRKTLGDPNYGRRRPAQGEGDALYDGDTIILTATPRCLCNTGCDTSVNYLIDSSITRLVGGGTKLDSNRYYFVDSNGDGEFDSGEPFYGDGQRGTTDDCAGVHATTYPSGHSSEVWTVAMFLMQMIPSKYKEIYKAAYDYTVSRTIVRAHWNSDVMYGKLVGTTIAPIINAFRNSSDGDFRTLYNAAKTMIDNAPSVNIQAQSN